MKGFICCLLVSVALLSACAPISAPLPEADASPAGAVPLADALTSLEPQDVWRNFYALTQVPRPSGHLEQVRAYLVQFGQDLGLETSVDDAGNVLIRKPAAPGMEDRKGVIPAHGRGAAEDARRFTTSRPTRSGYVDGEWAGPPHDAGRRRGISVAIAVTVLQSQTLATGPIEALFTVDRNHHVKRGPEAASRASWPSAWMRRRRAFIIGTPAASRRHSHAEVAPPGMAAVSVRGLKGGHSGVDIHRGQETQSNCWCGSSAAGPAYGVHCRHRGENAPMPSTRRRRSSVCPQAGKRIPRAVEQYRATIQSELCGRAGLRFKPPADPPANVMDEKAQRVLIAALYATPHGVMRMSDAVPGLVETSTNLGIVDGRDGRLSLTCNMRSSVDSALDDLAAMVSSVWELAGAETTISGRYPGWAPNAGSPLLALMQQVYAEMYGQPPQVSAVHAGLECGTIVAKYPGMDAISIGPTLHDVHTPDEALHIASVQKLVDFLFTTLSRVPAK